MDRDTRNRIQRATQAARGLLEREYGEQLEGIFDIRLDGTIASEPGGHLSAAERILWQKLVAAVEHRKASGLKNADAVADYLREAAFTTLNRFVALKMLEARGLVQECISRGDQSSAFKEFTGLAPGLVQLPDHGYRLYIESLFDEIGREVRVLFDRRDPASLLWPRRQALVDLLAMLNDAELAEVWKEDETIGWVYQYFNSDKDRERARYDDKGKPKPPQNSYELAVRNQFFTPRYVVEFLTDNTLGQIWYEMWQGQTRLAEECRYLVRRPSEVFLAEGAQAPGDDGNADDHLSQEELLKKTIYIPSRAKKDPRDLKVLDPACGSGHFLLYAFDLLLTIYEEGWEDADGPKSEVTGKALREDFETLAALRVAMPGLILRHNLHGIDIDPRCAQIAALALWMRAQRAYYDFGFAHGERAAIAKTNIIVAEPMPGERDLRAEFIASLDEQLGALVEHVFEKMELAGEAGSLLKIEDEIQAVIREIYGGVGGLFQKNDAERWQEAETQLLDALHDYAERAQNGRTYQRRLFSEDAARGLAFIDVCRQRYDVVLMNPPFGAPATRSKEQLAVGYPDTWNDIYAAFVERALLLGRSGRLGAITSSTFFNLASFKKLRGRLVQAATPVCFVDLGSGVMDDAAVSAACSIIEGTPDQVDGPIIFYDTRFVAERENELRVLIRQTNRGEHNSLVSVVALKQLATLPDGIFAYWLTERVRNVFSRYPGLGERATATFGLHCRGGDERFYRAWWEIPTGQCDQARWPAVYLGGKPQHFYRDTYYVVDWRDNARALCEVASSASGGTFTGREFYFKAGLTYIYTAQTTFSVQPLQVGSVFTAAAHGLFPNDELELWAWLGWLNSEPVRLLTKVINPNRFFQASYVRMIPVPPIERVKREFEALAQQAVEFARAHVGGDECSRHFGVDWATEAGGHSPLSPFVAAADMAAAQALRLESLKKQVDELVLRAYGFDKGDLDVLSARVGSSTALELPGNISLLEDGRSEAVYAHVSAAVGLAYGRWDIRYWDGSKQLPPASGAFEVLPATQRASAVTPLCPIKGEVGVDDPGHSDDLVEAIVAVLEQIWGSRFVNIATEIADTVWSGESVGFGLRVWLRSRFFNYHLTRYSGVQAQASIYWQLATPSASYSVWLYYHRITKDTFYKVLNDYVTPKLQHEERKLTSLVQTAGGSPTPSQRKEIAEQEAFVEDLRAFGEEVARVPPLWNPDLNDGVIINFALLWRLLPQHRAWQKEREDCWDKLVAGDYDWAHLAMHLWPERVVPKCAEDRSLAIAHDLEEVFWVETSNGKWQPRKIDKATIEKLIAERTSTAVKDALQNLLSAPSPGTSRGSSRRLTNRGSSPRSSRPAGADSRPDSSAARRGAAPDNSILDAVKEAIAVAEGGATKAKVISTTGLTDSQWNAAINVLLAQGVVTKTGERRAARYHLVKTGGES